MIGDWKLEFMAKSLIEELWEDREGSVEIAMDLIRKNYRSDSDAGAERIRKAAVEGKISKNKQRLSTLLQMRLDAEITKEEYAKAKQELEKTTEEL